MASSTGSIVLKSAAVLLAVSLSGLYIYSQWQGQADPPADAQPDASNMSKTPDLDIMRALPKSGPLEIPPGNFNPDPPEDDPAPNQPWKTPGFDLNDALSKTGTIKTDKLLDTDDGGAGLFGSEEQDKPEEDAKE